jgi:hypothetical protein
MHNADYPAKSLQSTHFKSFGIYDQHIGVNHGGGKWLNFRGYKGEALPAFINATLNKDLNARLNKVLA